MEESITFEFPEYLEELFQVQAGDIRQYSPLTLAYIGDCIYDLVIKSLVLYKGNKPVHAMHEETSKYVQASAQSQMMRKMQVINPASFLILILETLLRFTMEN